MQKGISLGVILLVCFTFQISFSQNSTSSPYTQFGIGDLTNKGFGWSNGMGGAGYGLRSANHINFKNPASYTAMDSMSFNFAFGFKSKITQYVTVDDEHIKDNSNISFLAISFPVTKWLKSSIGLMPYSNIGYGFMDTVNIETVGNTLNYDYGAGGINQFYIGNSVELNDQVSLGFNLSYLFGSLQHIRTLLFMNSEYYNTQREDVIRVSDFHLSYGLQYYNDLNDKISYCVGVNFENESKIRSFYNSITLTTISPFVNEVDRDQVRDTVSYTDNLEDNIILPTNIGLGLSVYLDDKYIISADYNIQSWSNSKILGKTDSLINSNSLSLGLEYTPDYKSALRYWKRMNYRFGTHYTNSYIQIFDEQIKDLGISFGLGIPIKRSKSIINVAFDFGKRGTTDNNLILENYGIISLNVSLSDIWFVKRKFD